MKILAAFACLVLCAVAEPPPSNSYLPPSSRGGGYPSGGPGSGVSAARSQGFGHGHGHGHGANGFARSGHGSHGGAQGRFGSGGQGYDQGSQGYDQNGGAFGRNGLDGEPANYNFGYMVNDYHEGTDFGHHEERKDEKAHGEYHVVLPDGRKQTVSYEADERGFKPHISYEDTDASARGGGYDGNGHNHGGNGRHGNGFNNNGRSGYN